MTRFRGMLARRKLLLIALLAVIIVAAVASVVVAAENGETGRGGIWTFLLGVLGKIFALEAVQTLLASIIVAGLVWLGRRLWFVNKIVKPLAIQAYEYAEREGKLQNLKGHEKWGPFMAKLAELWKAETGNSTVPVSVETAAVLIGEKRVAESKAINPLLK